MASTNSAVRQTFGLIITNNHKNNERDSVLFTDHLRTAKSHVSPKTKKHGEAISGRILPSCYRGQRSKRGHSLPASGMLSCATVLFSNCAYERKMGSVRWSVTRLAFSQHIPWPCPLVIIDHLHKHLLIPFVQMVSTTNDVESSSSKAPSQPSSTEKSAPFY